jgi:hypothetical protein
MDNPEKLATQATQDEDKHKHSIERFLAKLFSIAEVNSRFIDIHPCLGSILNVFHKHIINATTTAINTCKKCN